jgi:hypothetical protein
MTNPQSVCLRTAGKGDRPERDFSANGESFHNRNCDSAAHRACQHRKELGPIKHLKQATNSARARHVMLARNPVISAGFYPPKDSSGQPARFTRRKCAMLLRPSTQRTARSMSGESSWPSWSGQTVWPLAAHTRQPAIPVIGFVNGGSSDAIAAIAAALRPPPKPVTSPGQAARSTAIGWRVLGAGAGRDAQ